MNVSRVSAAGSRGASRAGGPAGTASRRIPGPARDDAHPIEEAVVGLDRIALVLGSEGHGLSPRWEKAADRRAVIPMREGIDSLNVAAAAAVACYVVATRR